MSKTRPAKDQAMRGYDCEPQLEDMLSDPMMLALMESDGVEADEIKNLLTEARERYQAPTSRLRRR
jgi:hypothetical protein